MGNRTLSYTIEEVFKAAVAGNRAVAVWRLPESEKLQVCVSLQSGHEVGQPHLEQSPFGFLFCPFQPQDHPNIFIKADVYLDDASGAVIAAPDAPLAALEQFYVLLSQPLTALWHLPPPMPPASEQTAANYIKAVADAIEALQQGEMEKVVLSRNTRQELTEDFDLLQAFKKLQQTYPRAFVSLVSVPGLGTWLGASPEILVSIDQQNHFRTVALAGTQPAANAESVASAIWRQKEIEEQAMVERYILSCFKKLRLREYSEVGPRTVVAGNLMHLRTDFKVDLEEVDFPTLGSDMLQLLHPTSAVCGLPKEPALAFILASEGYDRSYYSGYLGPVNSGAGTHLYVNLRCMQLLATEAILYAGAGITAASTPEHEWYETEHKMQTMTHILQQF
ncbi:isochorismate synthase [Pontibacter ummariensis]|uniref:isochorismate synthase n=1 Tax=Pontibacter ummariensis TaxID=1610492 RepID=A0A239C097_9BACT|nr:isochorismate synthase [Pontibacter ummariensis]PRY15518.1 isochorismate synthase [Pontibacter ummariensis]SNS13586.1 isochorismate synthase [Pontibacter ummariensis]